MKTASNSNYKPIFIRVNQEEYNNILQQAECMSLSINRYAKKRLLDKPGGCRTQLDYIMRLIPRIYAKIDQIEDITVRTELEKEVSQICQYLR